MTHPQKPSLPQALDALLSPVHLTSPADIAEFSESLTLVSAKFEELKSEYTHYHIMLCIKELSPARVRILMPPNMKGIFASQYGPIQRVPNAALSAEDGSAIHEPTKPQAQKLRQLVELLKDYVKIHSDSFESFSGPPIGPDDGAVLAKHMFTPAHFVRWEAHQLHMSMSDLDTERPTTRKQSL